MKGGNANHVRRIGDLGTYKNATATPKHERSAVSLTTVNFEICTPERLSYSCGKHCINFSYYLLLSTRPHYNNVIIISCQVPLFYFHLPEGRNQRSIRQIDVIFPQPSLTVITVQICILSGHLQEKH